MTNYQMIQLMIPIFTKDPEVTADLKAPLDR